MKGEGLGRNWRMGRFTRPKCQGRGNSLSSDQIAAYRISARKCLRVGSFLSRSTSEVLAIAAAAVLREGQFEG